VEGIAEGMRKEMTAGDIQSVVAAFAKAAHRAKVAGFDGIQIHGAHGYLLSEFMSPMFNQRSDEYGGSIENRARLPLAVVASIREAVGPDYPVLIKMNCKEFKDNGLMPDDFIHLGKLLAEAGIDAIEVSGGIPVNTKTIPSQLGINREEKEAYFQEEAAALKKQIDIPIILVGGNRSFHVCERLVAEGLVDYISMSRPLIREPHLINRWKAGDLTRAACKSDNLCFRPAVKGEGIYCVTEKREQAK
jgi:2,4-dienoyl-CoA reductase-like NADH-dependent reductase (Old Yellow Enzyme family)